MDTDRVLTSHTWTYIKERIVRVGHLQYGEVYCSADGLLYLRTGESRVIANQATYLEKLTTLAYPVPKILERGTLNPGKYYYIEESIGETTFGQQFTVSYKQTSTISSLYFDEFIAILLKFLQAQCNTAPVRSPTWLTSYFYVDKLQKNYPIDPDLLKQTIKKLQNRLHVIPLVYGHGDLTPFNATRDGVFDVEQPFVAPIGYDVLAILCTGRLWDFSDDKGLSNLAYDFTDDQQQILLAKVDDISKQYIHFSISQYIDDFTLLKMMWCLMHDNDFASYTGSSKRLEFHVRAINYAMRCYIADQPIDRTQFRA